MSLIALKFVAAGSIALGLLFVSMAIGAGCSFFTKSAPGGSRYHPDRKNQ